MSSDPGSPMLAPARTYVHESLTALRNFDIFTLFSPWRLVELMLNFAYVFLQVPLIVLFKPAPPKSDELKKPFGRIAVIGAGLTGISSAAHAIAHNFDVVIYEASDRPGGIWSRVNKTSGLQLNSLLYRFHPAVRWRRGFPERDEILDEIKRVWKEYKLEGRTQFNTPVTSIRRAPGTSSPGARWLVNDGSDGAFDALIVTVGTCGKPRMIGLKGMPKRQKGQDEIKGNAKGRDKARAKAGQDGMPSYADVAKHGTANESKTGGLNAEAGPDQASVDPRDEGAPSYADVAKYEPDSNDAPPTELAAASKQADAVPGSPASDASSARKESHHRADEHPNEDSDAEHEAATRHDTNEDKDAGGGGGGDDDDDDTFDGPILHSSELDREDADMAGKTVIVVGSGASGVEAVEAALTRGAKKVAMVARDDKWIIPRNIVVDTAISAQPFGREMPLSFLWEGFLRNWHYRGVKDLTPADRGIFEGTPVVNDAFLGHVRAGRVEYIRGDTLRLTKQGVRVRVRPRGSKPGDEKQGSSSEEYPTREFPADVVVLATGFEPPSVDFLPQDLFPKDYARPDLYLQNFSTEDWSVLMTNSSYLNAIGTVGHFHIGIYTRILLTLLLDKDARPPPRDMKLWVDALRFVKRGARGGALGFFTYMELTIWFVMFHVLRPDRLRWIFFVMQGWGVNVNKVGK